MSSQQKPRILCVSRSPFQIGTLCETLPAQDYDIISASTPEQAVAFFVSNKLDAVVLDSEFATDGWSAAATFKMVNPQLPVILVRGQDVTNLPYGVDAIADSHSHLVQELEALLQGRG